MRLASTPSCRDTLSRDFQQCRLGTLALYEGVDSTTFKQQIHPEFSPIGWHLGHIGFTESYWILERCAGESPLHPEYRQLFAVDGLPKAQRGKIPELAEVCDYLQTIRQRVLKYLETAPLDTQERLWQFILQHEVQHGETVAFVLQMIRLSSRPAVPPLKPTRTEATATEMVKIPAGGFEMGAQTSFALDNERPSHWVELDTYWIDRYPVTCGQYQDFMAKGGYQTRQWWSDAGWQWLQDHPVNQPLYWHPNLPQDRPACGISYYEAEAYANFVGKRLPTEAEWEKAARWDHQVQHSRTYPWGEEFPTNRHCNHNHAVGQTTPVNAYSGGESAYGVCDLLGNVWEWTATWFDGYEGFQSFPYLGYSQVYFDRQHRVLKGGSWATRPWGMRSSFRNWYHPGVRQILAGFRCVRDSLS
ncbi:ergothioneine biosynthesis protein EgtB [Geitlerinema calcuttense]|uniref:Ergothioneine biosynthesis protein EgtB n=1 Tax=Geitlerinema calcuttense NRMC-F 0142 TaxID=2922238 RepID=A0ABT7LYX1_9CYAN|nr:ergothioneine biosynthesis protein EgtB [Geitlerinema calcuttense]MCD8486314.1 ergothioneine biosynthesis protein EgtB [Desertifilum sp.]MDL5057202.1 ergothioneine biosynthesis protein EgtB [Geitlerinema calcuttense NRMC-F 0142]